MSRLDRDRELDRLLMELVDGELSPEQQSRLMELLRDDPAARARYVRYMLVDSHLAWAPSAAMRDPSRGPGLRGARGEKGDGSGVPSPAAEPAGRPARDARGRRASYLAAVAAAVLIASIPLALRGVGARRAIAPAGVEAARPTEPSRGLNPGGIGVLTRADGVVWGARGPSPAVGATLHEGIFHVASGAIELGLRGTTTVAIEGPAEVELQALPAIGSRAVTLRMALGNARLRFACGAVVRLHGPATLDVESERAARLRMGVALVHARAEAVGFTLRTPSSDFVDLGTEFGAVVGDDGSSEVHVFEGVVIARPYASEQVAPVLAREAGRVDARIGGIVAVPIDPRKFPERKVSAPSPRTPTPQYEPIPSDSRIIFLGDGDTDLETHILLARQSLADRQLGAGLRLFNAAVTFALAYHDVDVERHVRPHRPTIAVVSYGPAIAVWPGRGDQEWFQALYVRLLDRLEQEGIEAILTTGYPQGPQHPEAQRDLDAYNEFVRRLARERNLRLSDVDHRFRDAGPDADLLIPNGKLPNFEGYRLITACLLEALGYAEVPVSPSITVSSMLPGVITDWKIRFLAGSEPLDAAAIDRLEPDGSWRTLTLPQDEDDQFARRASDPNALVAFRDRARGFATHLCGEGSSRLVGVAQVEADRPRDAFINVGADVRGVWLNGIKLYKWTKWDGWHAGKQRIPVRLRPGPNRIVVEAKGSFFLSVTDNTEW
jgi:hypothetical protein